MLPLDGDGAEDLVDIGHVEIGTDAKIFRPPVAPSQKRMDIGKAALSRCRVTEVSHIDLSGIGNVAACEIRILKFIGSEPPELLMDGGKDLFNGLVSLGPLSVKKLFSRGGIHHETCKSGTLLTPVMLFLHHEIELVETIHPGAIFAAIVVQRLHQPHHGHSAFMFKLFHVALFALQS